MPATALLPEPPALEPSSVFFISEFSERFPFVFERFHQVLSAPTVPVGVSGLWPLRLERLEESSKGDLKKELDNVIERAALFIADITPSAVGETTRWNPNVMYEIGRAHQAQAPVFMICDQQFDPKTRREQLPWDINTASIHWYHFSPGGLDGLLKGFQRWLAAGHVRKYHNSRSFISSARRIRNTMAEWVPVSHQKFKLVLDRVATHLEHTVADIATHLKDGTPFAFRPLEPRPLVDALFAGTMDLMEAGDAYDAVSTIDFWSGLGKRPQFLEMTIAALVKGVAMQRLFLVPNPDTINDARADAILGVLRPHVQAADVHTGYAIRCLITAVDSGAANDEHCGVCRWHSDKTVTSLRPVYRPVKGAEPELVGIDYEVGAMARRREFEASWNNPSALTAKQYVARLEQLFPSVKKKGRGKRAPRRATDLSAQMTLGNHTIVGRVISMSSSGAFFVPRALPGERLDQPQPTRLSLVHGRKSEQHDVELRRVGPTDSPNVLGFGVRFVRPSGQRRGGGSGPDARG
jgi:hypothetical protein